MHIIDYLWVYNRHVFRAHTKSECRVQRVSMTGSSSYGFVYTCALNRNAATAERCVWIV